MYSQAFRSALAKTGYLPDTQRPAPGVTLASDECHPRLRAVLGRNNGIGLEADAVFSAQDSPISIFKDAGTDQPTADTVLGWREAAWNVGLAPILWVVSPTDVRIYGCYRSPVGSSANHHAPLSALATFSLDEPNQLTALDMTCGRLATETGAFWSSQIGKQIDRRHRVDRELLEELRALEKCLVELTTDARGQGAIHRVRDLAQRFIGRCIFMRSLLDRQLVQRFLPPDMPDDISKMFETPENACKLFRWLHSTFDGELFPIEDPLAEREHLNGQHLELIRSFIDGYSLIPGQVGQRRLFRFRFDAIPVTLISSIYGQFAQSRGVEADKAQGVRDTPIEIVQLVLDTVFEGLDGDAQVLDPTCGSGTFLVESFRRLVWLKTRGAPASRQLVRQVLHQQLYGVDINAKALSIAAFCLHLAALELDDEPVEDIRDLRIDRLIGKTLFQADALAPPPVALASKKFDAVVGDPPWTFALSGDSPPWNEKDTVPLQRRPDWKFLDRARLMTTARGRIGMVMEAAPFFAVDKPAVEARNAVFEQLQPCALINLSQLRREELFPEVAEPAVILFARCELAADSGKVLVGSVPWSPEFRRTGIFQTVAGEIRPVALDRLRAMPSLLKTAAFGTVRDERLMERIQRSFISLEQFCTDLGILPEVHRDQGLQAGRKSTHESTEEYLGLPLVDPGVFAPFRIQRDQLGVFNQRTPHQPRNPSIFRSPLLLCPTAIGLNDLAPQGRYSVSICTQNALYSEGFFGLSFATAGHSLVHLLSGILNSSWTTFQLAFGCSSWGVEHPKIGPQDLLSLRVPSLTSVAEPEIRQVVRAEQHAAQAPKRTEGLMVLDEAVCDLCDLGQRERVVLAESVERARHLCSDQVAERRRAYEKPSSEHLRRYAIEVIRTINAFLRARGVRHLEATLFRDESGSVELSTSIPGATVVRFAMAPGAPGMDPVINQGDPSDTLQLANRLRNGLDAECPPYLNESRLLHLYGADHLLILKPSRARFWTRTAGLNDADTILADHWYRQPHGVSHN